MTEPAASGPGINGLVERCFRHEATRIVAVLTAQSGPGAIDVVEDAVQFALLRALERWRFGGAPANPAGWLYTTARNHMIDRHRRGKTRARAEADPVLAVHAEDNAATAEPPQFEAEIAQGEVGMAFACCHPTIPPSGQVALALKLMGGFSTAEIARRLMTTEETAGKRVRRAIERFRQAEPVLAVPPPDQLAPRLAAVHAVIYAIFAEGYQSAHPDSLIRRELCDEAIRLCAVLLGNPVCGRPSTRALMALMLLHTARFDARIDPSGAIVLLRAQDRSRWDRKMIAQGLALLADSAEGDAVSRYHLEAGIAARHCIAESYETTDWAAILADYDRLGALSPDPLHAFNRCVALAEVAGPQAAIDALITVDAQWSLQSRYYLFDAAMGEFNARLGRREGALLHFRAAYRKAQSRQEQRLLESKIAALDDAAVRRNAP